MNLQESSTNYGCAVLTIVIVAMAIIFIIGLLWKGIMWAFMG